jgi:hypothetical protein
MDYKLSIIYGIVGIIVDYISFNIVVPLLFPKVYTFQKMKNKLDIVKVSIPLSLGSCNFDSSSVELNTSNPFKSGFIFMPHSNNLKGGAQFSYSFWLDVKSNNALALRDKNIFMRGLPNKVEGSSTISKFPLVVCPLVKFGNVGVSNNSQIKSRNQIGQTNSYLEVIFNTFKNPHAKIVLNQGVFDLTRSTNTNPRWFLISLVFQDYIDFSNAEKGIQIQSYINDNLVNTEIMKNDSLKINTCNLFLTPNTRSMTNTSSHYADLTYYNHALNIIDIEKIYNYGISDLDGGCKTAKPSDTENRKDVYHRLSMNNYIQ